MKGGRGIVAKKKSFSEIRRGNNTKELSVKRIKVHCIYV